MAEEPRIALADALREAGVETADFLREGKRYFLLEASDQIVEDALVDTRILRDARPGRDRRRGELGWARTCVAGCIPREARRAGIAAGDRLRCLVGLFRRALPRASSHREMLPELCDLARL